MQFYSLLVVEVVKVSFPHNRDKLEAANEDTAVSRPLHIAVMLLE